MKSHPPRFLCNPLSETKVRILTGVTANIVHIGKMWEDVTAGVHNTGR
jgi:hypothetical protein